MHPFQLLLGASLVGSVLAAPLAAGTGQLVWPVGWGAPEWAVLLSGVLNAVAYAGYVWLVGRAGLVGRVGRVGPVGRVGLVGLVDRVGRDLTYPTDLTYLTC